MKIGVDLRSLQESKRSGVGEYTYKLLDAIFRIDSRNNYFLFYNSFKGVDNLLPKEWGHLPNVRFCGFRYPNKLLNFSLKFLKRPRIDRLVQKNNNLDLFFLPNLNFVALSSGVKKIITVHDLSFERYSRFFSWKRRLWHKFINPRKLIRGCDKVIAVSENTKRDLVELYGIQPEKIEVVYSGVVKESEIVNQESGIELVRKKYNLSDHFILFLGTLEPRKNIEGLIRAFEILKKSYQLSISNYQLVIVGPKGWLCKKILKRAEQSPLREDIKFINYISPEEKFSFYRAADLFVYPSFYEGFGFPPLEAAAVGTPVIISAASSLSEVMGEAALMVDPNNPVELAESMRQCLIDQELRKNLIEKGKKRAEEFSWEKCAQAMVELFNQLG